MLKKIILGFVLVASLSLVFAQDKKLEEYLDEIQAIVDEDKALDESFQSEYDAAMEELREAAKNKMDEIVNQDPYPWEDPYEYSDRINKEVLQLRTELDIAIEEKDAELRTPYKISKTELAIKKDQAWIDLKQIEFRYNDTVETTFYAFDVFEKCWPFIVTNNDEFLDYTSDVFQYKANVLDIANDYHTNQELIDGNEISSELLVKVRQDNTVVDAYEIYLVSVTLSANGEVLRAFTCDEEVIKVGRIE